VSSGPSARKLVDMAETRDVSATTPLHAVGLVVGIVLAIVVLVISAIHGNALESLVRRHPGIAVEGSIW
jgi:hypothetical protein